MQLCAAGAKVTAVDHSPQRMERLRENLVRQGFTAQLVLSDASDLSVCSGFDCVLLDAPCSATGTLRRHPELAWIKDVGSIYSLAIAQRKLLLAAARYVRPGGELVYCTCSLEQEEGEEQVSGFLRTHRNFRVNPIMLACEGVEEDMITPQGFLRTLPCMTAGASQGMDGFFAARFTRVS
jgi:16S rRNA (cytosine967-C5)-methyltransferase